MSWESEGAASGTDSTATVPALVIPPGITDDDLQALTKAVAVLEGSSLGSRLAALLGRQFDAAAQLVPAPVRSVVNTATVKALGFALRGAVRSLGKQDGGAAKPYLHMAAAALSGAAGGGFGLTALPLELPIATSIMLRSIADIARAEGEDLADPAALLACLEVFALGGGGESGPMEESGYLAMRSLLAKSVSDAARFLVGRSAVNDSAPAIVRLLSQVAARFGVAVSQKAMTQAVPVIGAVTGAAVNAAFTSHYQSIARAHFTVRRLERRYGVDTVRTLYEAIKANTTRRPDGPGPRPTLSDIRSGSGAAPG